MCIIRGLVPIQTAIHLKLIDGCVDIVVEIAAANIGRNLELLVRTFRINLLSVWLLGW